MINRTKQGIYAFAEKYYNSNIVRIDHDAIARLELPTDQLSLIPSFLPVEIRQTPVQGIAFLLSLNAINYMFWTVGEQDGGRKLSRYSFDGKEGAMGMRAAFDGFWQNIDGGAQHRATGLTAVDIQRHFGDIPDPRGRAENLTEVFGGGRVFAHAARLYEKILASGAVTADDAADLSREFPTAFNDWFYKREQLAMAMVAGFLAECGVPVDTSGLTMFADYQVPRSLRAMEILVFSPELQRRIDSMLLIPEGPGDEYAICASVILAGRAMARRFAVPEAVLDNFLWQFRKLAGAIPFHLTIPSRRY
jgi:hypothetical protein